MPELPEVETIVRELRTSNLVGRKIMRAEVYWGRSIAIPAAPAFCQQIEGQAICDITRRGKLIVFRFTQDFLLVHLRMTGKFLLMKQEAPSTSHERVRLYLDDGRILRYEDQRKFGKWYLLASHKQHFSRLGVEPLEPDFTLNCFEMLLQGHKTLIKPFLLNQKYIAGLGNIYVDEALWEAKINPQRTVNALSNSEIRALHQAIVLVLQKGVDNTGTSLGSKSANYFTVTGRRGGNQYRLNVFRRDGQACPRCCTTIVKIVVAQRGTHLCPFCQSI